jgi:hypothetical protein
LTPASTPDELYSVLEAFSPFLKSIDARTIAVRSSSDGEWENLFTSFFVSEKSVDEVKSLQAKLPKIRNNEIALFLIAAPFDYSPFEFFVKGEAKLQKVLAGAGSFGLGGITVRSKPFDPLKLKVFSSQRRIEGHLKSVLRAENSNSAPERVELWSIAQRQNRLAKEFGYEDVNDLIKEMFRTDDLSPNKDFELTICNLAKIEKTTFNTSSFIVEISKIVGLKNLQLNVLQGRSETGWDSRTVWRKCYSIDETQAQPTRETLSLTVQPPEIFPFDNITLKLIHRGSSLTIDETWIRAPLQNVVEPFLQVLGAFCSIDKFREMLLKPETFKNAPEKMFENAVSWLLSLAGFHTIYLGANNKATKTSFDVLRANESYHIGSTDIVAYEDNERLLLVECDLSGFEEKKIQKLIEIRDYFQNSCSYKELKMVPVLFSPRTSSEEDKKKSVAVVDGAVIKSMLEEIAKGDRKSARSKVVIYS